MLEWWSYFKASQAPVSCRDSWPKVEGCHHICKFTQIQCTPLGICQGWPQLASPLTMTKGFKVLDGVTLGAEGVLPGRQIESFLRVFKQFTLKLPTTLILMGSVGTLRVNFERTHQRTQWATDWSNYQSTQWVHSQCAHHVPEHSLRVLS